MERRFRQVDVFGHRPLSGNPLAVVLDAEGLDDDSMQALTRWTNLSEVGFLLPPRDTAADYKVRIFTLAGELPFAGHPTLGAASVWLATSNAPDRGQQIVQECGVGLVRVRHDADTGRLGFAAPPLIRDGVVAEDLRHDVCALLGLDPSAVVDAAWIDNGPGWVGLLVESAAVLAGLRPDRSRWRRSEPVDVGVAALHPADGIDLDVRAFFDDHLGRLVEDPATGSLNAGLAQWLLGTGRLAAPYVARQGTAIGRDARLHVQSDADTVWIAGRVREHVRGTIDLG